MTLHTHHPPRNSMSVISQLLLNRFWQNLKRRFLGPSKWHLSRQHLPMWHLSISGLNQLLLTWLWSNFKSRFLGQSLKDARSRQGQGKVKAWWKLSQGKVRARSEGAQGKVKKRSRKVHQSKVKASVRGQSNVKGGQGKVKERSRQGQGKVKATQAQPQPQLQFGGFWHNWT